MKSKYQTPEWEVVTFSADDIRMEASCTTNDCSDDCSACFYLVCEPQDVIVG